MRKIFKLIFLIMAGLLVGFIGFQVIMFIRIARLKTEFSCDYFVD